MNSAGSLQIGCTAPVEHSGEIRVIVAPLSRTSRVTCSPPSVVSVARVFEFRRLKLANGEVLELPRGIVVCGFTSVLRTIPGNAQSRSFCRIWRISAPR